MIHFQTRFRARAQDERSRFSHPDVKKKQPQEDQREMGGDRTMGPACFKGNITLDSVKHYSHRRADDPKSRVKTEVKPHGIVTWVVKLSRGRPENPDAIKFDKRHQRPHDTKEGIGRRARPCLRVHDRAGPQRAARRPRRARNFRPHRKEPKKIRGAGRTRAASSRFGFRRPPSSLRNKHVTMPPPPSSGTG
ncbi:hypothetical protein EVAR_75261_1 [Eumeta japonica]|uniref:Uncharacterized protein n=1 Tax=Eumeta variegata TaxID=151549 RepID=A0A4C1V863_EUMVA|nr:hypothetical protein EVAR_75261_1 [Eumeta japonica]